MTTVRNVVLAAAAVAAMVVAAGTAGADPGTPQPPSPAYQIPTPGGGSAFPGVQTYPPICGVAPLACALHYDAGTGTWQPTSAGEPLTPPHTRNPASVARRLREQPPGYLRKGEQH